MNIIHVVGARLNIMQVAPGMRALRSYSAAFDQVLIHTGQHCDFVTSQELVQLALHA